MREKRKEVLRLLPFLFYLFSFLCFSAQAEKLSLGTATPGGGFAVYGQAVADVLRDVDPGINLELRGTKGSRENIPLLSTGKLDLALVEGTIVQEAIEKGSPQFRVVAAMYSSPGMFAVRADSPYRTIADLKGERVILGAAGSGLTQLGRLVIEGSGLSPDTDFQVVLLQAVKDGPPMVNNGSAAAIWGAGLGWPGFEGVAHGPQGARFFGPTEAQITAIRAKYPYLQRLVIPAGSFHGQSQDIPTVGTWSFVLSRPDLPDEAAHRFAKALAEAQPALGKKLAQAAETTAQNTLIALPRPDLLHPGVMRYLEEAGVRR
ncbi:MAG TPA: TAXI family TRAP transporter solute-binding subunit [Burkholderiales bacterium]